MLGSGGQSPRGGSTRQKKHEAPEEHMLEICELGVRQYFGELAMLERGTHTASVVSITSVEVLILSRYDFYHLVDPRTQEMMQAYAQKFYFDENSIRKAIQEQHEWERYKGTLTVGLSPSHRPAPGRR